MDKDFNEAWKHYLQLCNLSAKDFYENELAEAGLESPFKADTVKNLVEELKKKI
jgi:hypothetical protein